MCVCVWIELGYIFSTKAIWRQRLNWQDSIRLLVRTLSSCCSKKNMVSFRRRTCWFSTAAAFSSYIDKTSLIIVVFSHSFSYVPLYQLHSKLVLPHVCTQPCVENGQILLFLVIHGQDNFGAQALMGRITYFGTSLGMN